LNISKKQFGYVKAVKANHRKEKLKAIKAQFRYEEKELDEARNEILKMEFDIRKNVNKIAELKGKLSIKMAEREKLRYTLIAFQ